MAEQSLLHVPAPAAGNCTAQVEKLAAADTDGAYSLVECQGTTDEWSSFPKHTGQYAVYVVDGLFLVRQGEKSVQLQKGDILHAPTLDSYRSVGDQPGKLLVLLAAPAPACRLQHIRESEGQALAVIGDIGIFRLPGTLTNDAFLLTEWRVFPERGVLMHTQIGLETFYVIAGRFALNSKRNEEKYTLIAEPGDLIHVPKGVPHAYQNVGAEPGTLLVIFAPAGQTQKFFEAIGRPVEDRTRPPEISRPDPETFQTLLQKYQVTLAF